MRPAGRLAAAIEIMETHASGSRPLRLVLSGWARSNRYAGSKDRAAIANLVYDALRRAGSHAVCMGSKAPRSLVLAAFARGWEGDIRQLEKLCNGEKHAPSPLSKQEKQGLARVLDNNPPEDALLEMADIPAWLHPSFKKAFGARAGQEGQALARRAPMDLRVNRLKVDRAAVLDSLSELQPRPLDLLADAIRIEARAGGQKSPRIEKLPSYEKGWFEVQDLGSQIAAALGGVRPGQQVLDLCAGSGGKTLAMAAMMENRGQIHAYDIKAGRLSPLPGRLRRAGVHNVRILPADNQAALDKLAGKMDVVLVDAPCSGSGIWRRRPDSKWRLTPGQLEERTKEQNAVLAQGARAVRPGGRLVYVTCSVLPEENRQRVEEFLENNPLFAPVAPCSVWAERHDTRLPASAIAAQDMLQLTPASSDTDGFFVAILQRT